MGIPARRSRIAGTLLVIGLLASTLLMLSLAEIHTKVATPVAGRFDTGLEDAIHGLTSPPMTRAMRTVTWAGSPGLMIPMLAIAALWFRWKGHGRSALLMLLSTVGAFLLSVILKLHFRRMRPQWPWALMHEESYSFPSGHSVIAVVLYGTLLYLGMRHLTGRWQRTTAVASAIVLIAAIGCSRIYLGVHYPSDVAAGYLVGVVWLAAVAGAEWYARHAK